MTAEETLPSDWSVETEQTVDDEFMGREYTNVIYRQEGTRVAVYINEIIDGDNVWRYNVHHSGPDSDLGVADDLETAKQVAVSFMDDSGASV